MRRAEAVQWQLSTSILLWALKTCILILSLNRKLGHIHANLQTLCRKALKTDHVFFFSPPKNVCNAFAIREFPSFVTSVLHPSGGLTSPLRGARSHLQHRASPPLTSTLHMLLTPPHWHRGHVPFFFVFVFLILWTSESRWLGEGHEPSLMTAQCRGVACLSPGLCVFY